MLLNIPPELRNKIYSHLLAHDLPILIHTSILHPRLRTRCTPGSASGHNPLALVCRQTYGEIVGLIFSHNTLEFHANASAYTTALQTCTDFLETRTKTLRSCLRRITIVESRFTLSAISQILTGRMYGDVYAFCVAHPRVKVILRLEGRPPVDTAQFMWQLVALEAMRAALRDEDLVDFSVMAKPLFRITRR